MPLFLDYVAHSEIGLVRKDNQDSGYVSPNMLVVADGMGGAAAGDLASAVAISLVRRADRPVIGEEMLEVLAGAVDHANDRIADLVSDDHTLDGMGTTLTGAMFDGEQLGLVHIGDSRAYLYRDGQLGRLTHDHSWVQSLVDEGRITAEEAAFHPHRSLLLKVLNGQSPNDPDTQLIDVRAGDRLLFCSDGLCGLVDDADIAKALAIHDLGEVLDVLVRAAHHGGGIDNITVILADVIDSATNPVERPIVLGAARQREIPAVRPHDETVTAASMAAPAAYAPAAPAQQRHSAEDEETSRYAPRARPRRRWIAPTIATVAALVVIAGGVLGGLAWSRTQYYVGAANQRVAIYQGLNQAVLGLPLSKVYQEEPILLSDLPSFYRERVQQTITTNNLDDARSTTEELRRKADHCISLRQARANPPAPAPTPSSPGPAAPPGPQPTPSAEPVPTPTAAAPTSATASATTAPTDEEGCA